MRQLARLDENAKRSDQPNAELERVGAQNAELIRTIADITKADREFRKPGK